MKWTTGTMGLLFAVAQAQEMRSGGDKQPPVMASNSDARYQIQSTLDTATEFHNTHSKARVEKDKIVLSGYVYGVGEKVAALRLAAHYAGGREIIDWIHLGGSFYGGR